MDGNAAAGHVGAPQRSPHLPEAGAPVWANRGAGVVALPGAVEDEAALVPDPHGVEDGGHPKQDLVAALGAGEADVRARRAVVHPAPVGVGRPGYEVEGL